MTNFEREQEEKGLDTVVSPVHEIAKEQIVAVWAVTANLEQLYQVVELPVDVPTDLWEVTTP